MEPAEWRSVLLRNRLLLIAIATALGAVTALVSSVPLPRGPVPGEQGLMVMASSLVVGLAAGYVARSRWAIALAPIAYIAAYELARLDTRGASLETIRF